MFQSNKLRRTVSANTISQNGDNWKNRKFFSIFVLTMLFSIANVCSYGQELVRDVGNNGLWGYIDRWSRELKIPYKYLDAKQFSEELAAVCFNEKWGYIDKTGKIVIPHKYERAKNFSEGIAAVRLDEKWGLIDRNGTEVVPCNYGSPSSAKYEFERVRREGIPQKQETTSPITENTSDIIVLKSGNEIKAKIIEITLTEIKYKAFDYLDGPLKTVAKSDVYVINYANGTREFFGAASKSSNSRGPIRPGEVAIGISPAFYLEKNLTMYGFSGKLRVGVAKPIRLELSSTFCFKNTKSSAYGIEVKAATTLWNIHLNMQTILTKDDRFLLYPLLGLGVSGLSIKMSALGESHTENITFFSMYFGAGFDVKLSKRLYFNVEPKYLLSIISGKAGHGFAPSAGFIIKF